MGRKGGGRSECNEHEFGGGDFRKGGRTGGNEGICANSGREDELWSGRMVSH